MNTKGKDNVIIIDHKSPNRSYCFPIGRHIEYYTDGEIHARQHNRQFIISIENATYIVFTSGDLYKNKYEIYTNLRDDQLIENMSHNSNMSDNLYHKLKYGIVNKDNLKGFLRNYKKDYFEIQYHNGLEDFKGKLKVDSNMAKIFYECKVEKVITKPGSDIAHVLLKDV